MRAPRPSACRSRPPRAAALALLALLALTVPVTLGAAPAGATDPPGPAPGLAQQEAQELLARGRHFLVQGDYGRALVALRKAAKLDPTSPTCRRLLSQAEAAARLGTGADVLEPLKEQYAARARSVIRQAELSLFDAKKALDARDYERAAQHARRALAATRYVANAERGSELRTRGQAILDAATEGLDQQLARQRQRDLERARAEARDERGRRTSVRAAQVRALHEKARRQYNDGAYESALATVEDMRRLAPDDEDVQALEQKVRQAAAGPESVRGRSPLRARREDELLAALDRELTPHPRAKVVLPAEGKGEPPGHLRAAPMAPWERDLRAKLAEEVTIGFQQTPLEDCVKQIAALSKVNVVLDPDAARETPITIPRGPMPLDALLRWVARFADLHYCLRDGAVLLTTGRGIFDEPVRRVYNVSSLVTPEDDAVPTATIDATAGMLGPVEPLPRRTAERKPTKVDTDGIGEGWVSFIRQTVAPASWDIGPADGTLQEQGPRYTIQYRNGRIVVVHTPDVHREIEELLNNFRRARTLQVHILGRFLQIEQEYLEKLSLQTAHWEGPDASGPGQGVGPQAGKRYAFTPIDLVNNPEILQEVRDPLTGATSLQPLVRFPINAEGGLDLHWDYIGVRGHSADAFIRAVLKKNKGTLLQAPRLTCFNTQRANLQVLINHNYVRRVSADEEPEIGNVPEGIIFDIQPFVSADRRYITLVLQPQQRELIAMTEYSYSTGAEDIDQDDDDIVIVGRKVQVPTTRLRSLGTTVTIPNGGTLVVGGFTEVEERAATAGLPFIEKVPLLRYVLRGFDTAEGRRSLILLITAETVEDIFEE